MTTDFTEAIRQLEAAKTTDNVLGAFRQAFRQAEYAYQLYLDNEQIIASTLTPEQLTLIQQGATWAQQQLATAQAQFWQLLGLPEPEM